MNGKSILLYLSLFLLASCAKMGSPDGGWFDEEPPRVIGASPADRSVHVHDRKINIYFNEFIKIDNPTEKVVVSPPQLEMPEIVGKGKRIQVVLNDSLKENTTYTVDFSDAISDNNEGNPLGNYTYTFSTGAQIDTLEVSGYVLAADNLEPVKGILVGLYSNVADSAFQKEPLLRVSRTDSRGHFVIKGIAEGNYRVYALQDMDGNYMYSQKSEMLAFDREIITPTCKSDVRQDTLWTDSLHIKAVSRVGYTHFLPDDIILRAFTAELTDRYFLKVERKEPQCFSLFYSQGCDSLPVIKGLNFDSRDAFVVENSEKGDTITYWLRDTALVNQDTLCVQLQHFLTDTAGILRQQTDTLEILSKESFAKRQKRLNQKFEEWQKRQEKAKKKGLPYDSIMPVEALKPEIIAPAEIDPDKNLLFRFKTPLAQLNQDKIHLYSMHDSMWYRAPFELRQLQLREYQLVGEWRPEVEYSLEMDSAAFVDIYGQASGVFKQGFRVRSLDQYSTLFVDVEGMKGQKIVAQLLNNSDKVVKEVETDNGSAEFYYVKPDKYYLRMFIDSNGNGKWDTGDYEAGIQAEQTYYYPDIIECKEKWDVTQNWNPTARRLNEQKPAAITKQKADQQKKVKNQNAERAKKLGIEYIPKF